VRLPVEATSEPRAPSTDSPRRSEISTSCAGDRLRCVFLFPRSCAISGVCMTVDIGELLIRTTKKTPKKLGPLQNRSAERKKRRCGQCTVPQDVSGQVGALRP